MRHRSKLVALLALAVGLAVWLSTARICAAPPSREVVLALQVEEGGSAALVLETSIAPYNIALVRSTALSLRDRRGREQWRQHLASGPLSMGAAITSDARGVVAGVGMIHAPTSSYWVTAFSRAGERKWRRVLPEGNRAADYAPAIALLDDLVIVAGAEVRAVDRQSGTLRWSSPLSDGFPAAAQRVGNAVLVRAPSRTYIFGRDGLSREHQTHRSCVAGETFLTLPGDGQIERLDLRTLRQLPPIPLPPESGLRTLFGCLRRGENLFLIGSRDALKLDLTGVALSGDDRADGWTVTRPGNFTALHKREIHSPAVGAALEGSSQRGIPVLVLDVSEEVAVRTTFLDLELGAWREIMPLSSLQGVIKTLASCWVVSAPSSQTVIDPSGGIRGVFRHEEVSVISDAEGDVLWLGTTSPRHGPPHGWAVLDPCALEVEASENLEIEISR